MLSKEECRNACIYLLNHCYEEDLNSYGSYTFTSSGFHESKVLKQLIEEHFDPKPYTFEELKPNMWVYDSVENRINKTKSTFIADFGIPYIKLDDGFGEWFIVEFEENRFYPVQKANERQCER